METRSVFLEKALEAAGAAGAVVRRHYESMPEARLKADGTPVTAADVEAEHAIKEVLAGAFPGHGLLGEETGASRERAEYLWLIDPIDGTKSFIRKTPFFSTQIALMHQGELVLGVSSAPLFDELAWAERGCGARLNGERLHVSRVEALKHCALSIGNLKSLAADSRWAGLGRLVTAVGRLRGYGDFLHYHLLAAGKLDAVLESDVNILDIAALAVIVEEAGGRFTDLSGAPVGLETTSVLATNGHLHEAIARYL